MTTKLGWEGLLYYGAPGSTASTLLENVRDANYDNDLDMADATVRGSGAAVPTELGEPVRKTVALSFQMLMKSGDTGLAYLIGAARTGAAVAIKMLPYSGAAGFNGDIYISCSNPQPLGGEQVITFTLKKMTNKYGREPDLNA